MAETPITAHTVITGHANADFDCLAAIIAAQKLYPDAVLVFPGSQERTLRNFFIQTATYLFNFVNAKDIDLASVQRLVVVDTQQRSRIPHMHPALQNDGLQIHLYDHHPASDEDLPMHEGIIKPWGATTTIICHEIERRGLTVTPEEATYLGLGIFEDTGSFTFTSTTPHDFTAGAWLKEHGMDLNVIADLTTRDMTAEQVGLLNGLLNTAETHDINGVEVVIADTSIEGYVGDFALLAHKMMDMENIRVLFALARMGDRVQLVARSRNGDVDVSRIAEQFGGGGHAFAASASIKDRTLPQVRDDLFSLLYTQINPHISVARLMTSPAVTIEADMALVAAAEKMLNYSLKAAPVVEDDRCVGVIEHVVADKAVSHGLGDVAVAEYMRGAPLTARKDDELFTIMEAILSRRQRLVPVLGQKDDVIGVLTRSDLVNYLVEEPARIPEKLVKGKQRERNIKRLMADRLPASTIAFLQTAGALGDELGMDVYTVGGFVRDILLGRDNLDIDLVVEGDGIAYARHLAERLGGRAKTHSKFQTAVVLLPESDTGELSGRVDVATARLEYYEHPAALPSVQLSSIKMDLYRRDFSVNALALRLNAGHYGELVDFFGAQRDVKEGRIRVLHSLSFVDDPTRILRAVRFEQRFKFSIGGQTERLIKNAVSMHFLKKLSGGRIFNELKIIFSEKNPAKCMRRLESLGVLREISPHLALDKKREEIMREVRHVLDWYSLLYTRPEPEAWKLYLLSQATGLKPQGVEELSERLALSKSERESFEAIRSQVGRALGALMRWLQNDGALSELFFILEPLPIEGVLFLMARSSTSRARSAISLYVQQMRFARLEIGGDDLKALGVEQGPLFGHVLRAVLAARLDAEYGGNRDLLPDPRDKNAQLALARQYAEGKLPLPKYIPKPVKRYHG